MFRRISTFGISLLLAGAAALAAPNFALAQHGGHGGGGGHFGGGHGGANHFGGSFGGFRGGYYGGYRHSGYGGYRGYYPNFYGGYGYYSPYYYGGSSYVPSYDVTPDYAADTYAPPATGSYQSMYTPNLTAHVTVNVPADAKVWFDGTPTKSTGAVREFVTPPLTLGTQYSYEIRAQWTEDGHEVTQSQKVQFSSGEQAEVKFPTSSATASTETGPVPQKR
jgi:uncharacterized protein (TIGR03000 family)